jgi:hypothetical protein
MSSVTYPVLSDTYTPTELQQNFTDVLAALLSINDSQIAADAQIAITKLGAYKQELWVELRVRVADYASWPAAGTVVASVPIPGSNGDGEWTCTDVSWVCTDTGAGVGAFAVELGAYAVGVYGTLATVCTQVMTNAAAANDSNSGRSLENGSATLGYAVGQRVLALKSTVVDATTMTAAGSFVSVTARLVRDLQVA